jgi:hypothetical protein
MSAVYDIRFCSKPNEHGTYYPVDEDTTQTTQDGLLQVGCGIGKGRPFGGIWRTIFNKLVPNVKNLKNAQLVCMVVPDLNPTNIARLHQELRSHGTSYVVAIKLNKERHNCVSDDDPNAVPDPVGQQITSSNPYNIQPPKAPELKFGRDAQGRDFFEVGGVHVKNTGTGIAIYR